MQVTKNTIYLLLTGGFLVSIGAFLTYLFIPPQIIEQEATTSAANSVTTGYAVAYRWVAPEGYEMQSRSYDIVIELPEPDTVGEIPVETALATRRSARDVADSSISLEDLSQMLWSAIGVTNDSGNRTAPSPGGVNPTAVFVIADDVLGLEPGTYEYLEHEHALGLVSEETLTGRWATITSQTYPALSPVTLMISGDMYAHYERHGEAAERLVLQETGHIGQNLYLQAETLDLGMIVMGGFDVNEATSFLGLPEHEPVVYLVPFGNAIE